MNFYKEFILTTLEICFAIFIIIFGYKIWNNFDQSEFEIAKYYDKFNETEILIEDYEHIVSFINDDNVKKTKLYMHNIDEKNISKNLLLKIDKDNTNIKDSIILLINNDYYELNKMEVKEDDYYYYFILDKISFEGYETKEYEVKILLKDKNLNKNILGYEFITTL